MSSTDAFKFFDVREMAVGMVPAIGRPRAATPANSATRSGSTPDYQVTLYEQLVEAGKRPRPAPLRRPRADVAAAGEGLWRVPPDFRPDYTPRETGLDRFVDYDKADFIGRAAALKDRATPPKKKLVTLIVDANGAEVVGYEIDPEGRRGGGSGDLRRLRALGGTRALPWAMSGPDLARDGETFVIGLLGDDRARADPDDPSL